MATGHKVVLNDWQRKQCRAVLERRDLSRQLRQRALILLLADERPGQPSPGNEAIATWADVDQRTVSRVRSAHVKNGFEMALYGATRTTNTPRKLTPDQEMQLLALMGTPPPPGYPRWTIRTLADQAAGLDGMPSVSRELVRRLLKQHEAALSPKAVSDAR